MGLCKSDMCSGDEPQAGLVGLASCNKEKQNSVIDDFVTSSLTFPRFHPVALALSLSSSEYHIVERHIQYPHGCVFKNSISSSVDFRPSTAFLAGNRPNIAITF